MMTMWERSIRHITRTVKPAALRLVRAVMIKAAVKKRRSLPSRSLPSELVFQRMKLRFQKGGVAGDQLARKLEYAVLRTRLMERKRERRDAARRKARPSVSTTCAVDGRRRLCGPLRD